MRKGLILFALTSVSLFAQDITKVPDNYIVRIQKIQLDISKQGQNMILLQQEYTQKYNSLIATVQSDKNEIDHINNDVLLEVKKDPKKWTIDDDKFIFILKEKK